jgi:inosine-uridine nucleoside N-ribohydrolase
MKRVIIDTDPGIDDAMAILFALAADNLSVEALTVVYGNVEVERGVENALKVLEVADVTNIPVARGAHKPLLREAMFAKFVHGKDGLGDVDLPPPSLSPIGKRAAELIVSTIMESPDEITLVALGPLTNVAIAICLERDIVRHVREIVVMGGTAEVAQFFDPNIANDPEAARIVFSSGANLTMVGLDVTSKTIVTSEHLALIEGIDTRVTDLILKMAECYKKAYVRKPFFVPDGFMFHDPTTLAYLVDPAAFETEMRYVDIATRNSIPPGVSEFIAYADYPEVQKVFKEMAPVLEERGVPRRSIQMMTGAALPPGLCEPYMRGFTVVDRGEDGAWSKREPNVNVCLDVDPERVIELFTQAIISNARV